MRHCASCLAGWSVSEGLKSSVSVFIGEEASIKLALELDSEERVSAANLPEISQLDSERGLIVWQAKAQERRRNLSMRRRSERGDVVASQAPLILAPTIGTQEYKSRLRAAGAKGLNMNATAQSREGLQEQGMVQAAAQTSSNSDCAYKVVVVGDSGVGKTALLLRFVCDSYYDAGVSGTIGVSRPT